MLDEGFGVGGLMMLMFSYCVVYWSFYGWVVMFLWFNIELNSPSIWCMSAIFSDI